MVGSRVVSCCRFSAMTMKAVGTAAMEMVQEVETQFDEVSEEQRLRSWCHIILRWPRCIHHFLSHALCSVSKCIHLPYSSLSPFRLFGIRESVWKE